MQKAGEPCVLEDRICDECGDCDRCELNPEKLCDNCCKCIESDADYLEVRIADILVNEEKPGSRTPGRKYKIKVRKHSLKTLSKDPL